jgi:hypothetical protein
MPLFVPCSSCEDVRAQLRNLNPQVQNITYDVADLYNYLDNLNDICGLVLNPPPSCKLTRLAEGLGANNILRTKRHDKRKKREKNDE